MVRPVTATAPWQQQSVGASAATVRGGGRVGRGGPVVDGSSHVFNVPDTLVVRSIRKHRCERQQVGVRQQQVARRHGELVWLGGSIL
jgi:hypothetical protein